MSIQNVDSRQQQHTSSIIGSPMKKTADIKKQSGTAGGSFEPGNNAQLAT